MPKTMDKVSKSKRALDTKARNRITLSTHPSSHLRRCGTRGTSPWPRWSQDKVFLAVNSKALPEPPRKKLQ